MSSCDRVLLFGSSPDLALLRWRRRMGKASRSAVSTTIAITIPITILSLLVKFGLDVLAAGFVLAAELFDFEIGVDERVSTVDETSDECDDTDALDVNAGDGLVADDVVELVCGSKPLTTGEAPSPHPVKPRRLMIWEAAIVLKELRSTPAVRMTGNAVANVTGLPVVVIHLVVALRE